MRISSLPPKRTRVYHSGFDVEGVVTDVSEFTITVLWDGEYVPREHDDLEKIHVVSELIGVK